MKLEVYYVDAFTSEIFSGNPAAVIFSELNDEALMQKIATENNLSETAFVNLKNNQIAGKELRTEFEKSYFVRAIDDDE